MEKKHIAVIMGGYSTEFEISLQSGKVVCDSIDTKKYNVYPVHILKEGWYYISKDGDKHPINKADFSFSNGTNTIQPDGVFNTIHGTPGEDGFIQAYLKLIGIPQTSCEHYEAALSFNKRDCLSVLKKNGILCANSYYVTKGVHFSENDIITTVGLPCFVKPNRAGSSFGISKVYTIEELLPAINKAFKEDHEIIVETALLGTEVSIGVYNDRDKIITLSPTEIVSENDYFDYEAKYLGKSKEITPARISELELQRVTQIAKDIYQQLNMKGVTRSDFIIQKGIPYFIEINTNPGLSLESIIPKQVKESGLSLSKFFDILLQNILN